MHERTFVTAKEKTPGQATGLHLSLARQSGVYNQAARLLHLGKGGFGVGGDLLFAQVLFMRRDRPLMAERIFGQAVAVAPELVGQRHLHRAARLECAVKSSVGILDVKVKSDAGAAARFRRKTAWRKFTAQHEHGITDFQLGVHDRFAVGCHEPADFLRAESLLVKLNGLRPILDNDVRSERVESIWNWFSHNLPFVRMIR